jgi:hypothetical protein
MNAKDTMHIKRLNRALYIVILTTLNILVSYGQANTCRISGEVMDPLGQSVPYCTIAVWQMSDSTLVTGVVTDKNGHYQIESLKPAIYELRFSHIQYQKTSLSVKLSKDMQIPPITLQPSSVELSEITVVGTKPLIKIHTDKIVYNVTNDPNAQRTNLKEIFDKLPLVTQSENNFLIRGHISPQYMINGKKSSLLTANPMSVLKNIPANTIKEIEVITKPNAKYDGDNSGGIINIITKDKAESPLSASIGISTNTRGAIEGNISAGAQINKVYIQGFYSHGGEPNYKEKRSSERINENDAMNYLLIQEGDTRKTKLHSDIIMLESSWEPDTMNIVNFSLNYLNYNTDTHNTKKQLNTMLNMQGGKTYSYESDNNSHNQYKNMNISANYQRKINKNNDLLLMYKYTDMPRETDQYLMIENAYNYDNPSIHNWQEVHNKEHTIQIDYTGSWSGKHFVNAGAKYIIRNNTNDSKSFTFDANEQWIYRYSPEDYFKHQQKVFAVYAEYMLAIKRWSYKLGLRNELTKEKVKYTNDKSLDFNVDFNDILPFTSLSYNLKDGDLLSASYQSRINRPGIAYLNPKIFYTDPSSIYYGNPDMNSEKYRTVGLEYSMNRPKYMINLSLDYQFCNNSIQSYYGINGDDLYYQTYNNSGENKSGSLSGYVSCSPFQFLRLSINASGKYVYLKDFWQDKKLTNKGWTGNLSSDITINFPKDFYLTLNGGYNFPRIDLQGKYFNFYYCSLSLSKSLIKKLDLTLSGRDIFWNYKKSTSRYDNQIKRKAVDQIPGATFEISLAYRFNATQTSVKKTSKTISNDDVLR